MEPGSFMQSERQAGSSSRAVPPLSIADVTLTSDRVSSPLAMSPSVPFPSSPTSSTVPPLVRSRTSPLRSPRTSQDSRRLSIASTASSGSASATSMVQRPQVLLRTRHASLPASVVQSRHQSIVGTPAAANQLKALNRVSVASIGSFGSVEEEGEEGEEEEDGKTSTKSHSPAPSRSTSFSKPGIGFVRSKPLPKSSARHSLPPPGSLPSFGSVLNLAGRAKQRSASPLRPHDQSRYWNEEERSKRGEKRLRIAEELRDTEKAYVTVLEEIDSNYYQPLLQALPAVDPLARRASNRYSSAVTSPNTSPRSSTYERPSPAPLVRSRTSTAETCLSTSSAPSCSSSSSPPSLSAVTSTPIPPSPPQPTDSSPVLSRREINEVFSNFTDVLNLSHVMLLTLNEAVPQQPRVPLSNSPPTSSAELVAPGSVASRLSSNRGTIESTGPLTPDEDDSTRQAARPDSIPRTRHASTCERAAASPPLRLGKTLLPIVPFLKQYSLFVANFSGSLSRLSSLERLEQTDEGRNTRWKEFIRTRNESASNQGDKLGLGGMLLNIVQRVPRYRLLLSELLECTEQSHPDLKDLQAAFRLVDSVATHLDTQIESHTHDLSILNLQRCFTNLGDFALLCPGRRLLKTGRLSKFNRAGDIEQERHFFLFNDLILHAASIDRQSWASLGMNEALATNTGFDQSYRLVDKFELEDVTVVGSEEGSKKYGFELLTSRKSFAVYADSLEVKLEWLDAIRDAKAALMSDRRTLQRATIYEPVAPTPHNAAAGFVSKTDRRVSLPSPSKDRSSFLGSSFTTPPSQSRQASLVPKLGTIPPTPADELEALDFQSPNPRSSPSTPPLASSDSSPGSTTSSSVLPETPSPTRRPSLARARRWSDLRASDAVQAIASAFSTSTVPLEQEVKEMSKDEMEYKVIEAYNAPVWVPNAKTDKCMRCGDRFGLWRRKHHCRLCGGVVCWACSTRYFIIPGSLLSSTSSPSSRLSSIAQLESPEDRLARSCDTCYSAVFDDPVPSSRFLGSSTPVTTFGRSFSTLQPCVDKTATLHRLSRIINPQQMPLFDELGGGEGGGGGGGGGATSDCRVDESTPTSSVEGTDCGAIMQKRRRRLTAMGTLQDLLAKQQ